MIPFQYNCTNTRDGRKISELFMLPFFHEWNATRMWSFFFLSTKIVEWHNRRRLISLSSVNRRRVKVYTTRDKKASRVTIAKEHLGRFNHAKNKLTALSQGIITQTCLYYFDPIKPHFYIVRLGFTGVYFIFLFLLKSIDCGYSLEPPRRGSSNEYQHSMFWAEIRKLSDFFIWKFSFFGGKNFSIFERACFRNVKWGFIMMNLKQSSVKAE